MTDSEKLTTRELLAQAALAIESVPEFFDVRDAPDFFVELLARPLREIRKRLAESGAEIGERGRAAAIHVITAHTSMGAVDVDNEKDKWPRIEPWKCMECDEAAPTLEADTVEIIHTETCEVGVALRWLLAPKGGS